MPDKLSKKKSSRHSTTTSFRDVEIEDRNDRVTYVSTNKKEKTEFFGSAPPNSRLAATLAQVAAAVQADNLPRYGNDPARMISGSSPRGQIQAAPPTTTYEDEQEDYVPPPRVNDVREPKYPRTQERSAYQSSLPSQPQPDGRYSAGTRHELDQKVAYHTKGPNGELYVSAPTGSNEAQLFDEMAWRMSKSNVRVIFCVNSCGTELKCSRDIAAIARRSITVQRAEGFWAGVGDYTSFRALCSGFLGRNCI